MPEEDSIVALADPESIQLIQQEDHTHSTANKNIYFLNYKKRAAFKAELVDDTNIANTAVIHNHEVKKDSANT